MLKLIVEQDTDPFNPREMNDGYMGTMICFHGRYDLGDSHAFSCPQEFEDYTQANDIVRLPLYLYDHSGITMNTTGFSCPWDSGQVGYIYVTKENIRKEYNIKRISQKTIKQVLNILKAEVSEYDSYLTGEVYGYRIVEIDKNDEEVEELDACWGFIGDESYCRKEGEASMEYFKKKVA